MTEAAIAADPSPPPVTPAAGPAFYSAIAAVVFGCASCVDLLVGEREIPWVAALFGFGIGLLVGALAGAVLGFVLRHTARAPWWAKLMLWLAVGAAVAAWLVHTLGVLSALEGQDKQLAIYSLVASVASGTGLVILAMLVHPSRTRPYGFVASLRWRWRIPFLLLLAATTAALIWADRTLFVGTYPTAHLALRAGGLLIAFALFASTLSGVRLPRKPAMVLRVLAALIGLAPLAWIRPSHHLVLGALLEAPYSTLATSILRGIGDPDLDGYSAVLGGGDCNSVNRSINPAAAEIPGNGIDDNCRLGDAANVSQIPAPETVPKPSEPAPMSVVVITIDTLRADHMGLYDYERDTTPNMDAWAEEHGVTFERAYTSGGWTSLALSSLFRGVYPRRLSWARLHETNRFRLLRAPLEEKLRKGERPKKAYGMPLDEKRKPLAHWLRRRGMKTIAVVDDGFSEFLSRELGLGEGYDQYMLVDKLPRQQRGDQGVTARARQELRNVPKDKPFFMWCHYFGPHNPDSVHPGVPRFGSRAKDGYDHEILFTDKHVGDLLAAIEEERKKRPIAVVLTSDHGEIIHKSWRNHGIDLSEDSIHIPFVLSVPGLAPGRNERLVSLVDIMPTVLSVTRTPAPYAQDGVNLLELVKTPQEPSPPRVVIAEFWRYDKDAQVTADRIVALDGLYKLEWDIETEAQSLWRTIDRYRPGKRSYLGEVDIPHLEETLGKYLEENGKVDVHD